MPTIIAYTADYPPGRWIGAELATHNTLRYLVERGWECYARPATMTASAGINGYEIDGVRVVREFAALPRPDIVLTHALAAPTAVNHALGARAPLVLSFHSGLGWASWVQNKIDSMRPALVIVNSRAMARQVQTSNPDRELFTLHPPTMIAGHEIRGRSTGAVTMIGSGDGKGVPLFYEIARQMPNVPFIHRQGGYSADQDEIEALTGPRPANLIVQPHGPRHTILQLLANTSVLLVPSMSESWGMVAVEAMTSGIPVIGSRVEGLLECLGWEILPCGTVAPQPMATSMLLADPRDASDWPPLIATMRAGWDTWSTRASRRAREIDLATGKGLEVLAAKLAAMVGG